MAPACDFDLTGLDISLTNADFRNMVSDSIGGYGIALSDLESEATPDAVNQAFTQALSQVAPRAGGSAAQVWKDAPSDAQQAAASTIFAALFMSTLTDPTSGDALFPTVRSLSSTL